MLNCTHLLKAVSDAGLFYLFFPKSSNTEFPVNLIRIIVSEYFRGSLILLSYYINSN